LQYVTQGQLKKHANETARRQSILAMGGNPNVRNVPLRIIPITGNDIFPPQAPAPAPPADDMSNTEPFVNPPPQSPSLPRVIPSHSIEDDDFPPDTANPSNSPPPDAEFPKYPSFETSDEDEDVSETGDQDEHGTKEQAQCEENLDEFMDFEFLNQG
jgi:hypothetical protein